MSEIIIKILEPTEAISPFEKWYNSIKDKSVRRRILVRIKRLELGNFGDWKNLGEGVYELRMSFGSGYRVYFARQGNEMVIILGGGDKRSQAQDITNAKALWREYKNEIERFSRDF
ncbi:type II toxin-antitoxin system RelE/ParE family toxin [Dactylococcopsis salina]|uniref:Addiction module killer protein n=1 Tax=Dactylococcopsis salina (strain PCC 8305) TaxID=13035 RepID=K9YQ93_DACS8|nr:type II toxin-antitoxin system RelE/ParE family toxin [Dactylococcopsis salina]AFZ49059.1 putative addiction module killer protein [Dactylococcopsis salina PCC 8305]